MNAPNPDIPGYRIERALGVGSQARVWRAIQESLQRPVALKVLRADLGLDADALLREAQLAGSIAHPHVVHVHDCGRHGDLVYIAQEWVDGVDAERLRHQQGGRLPLDVAMRVVRDAALGAAAIADAGLVHRDIKPANLLVVPDGATKVADLGCAYRQSGGRTMTATGVVVGTPLFMAPEQARGEADLDVRCDVYALGATLFTLVTGLMPTSGANALETMARIADAPLPDPAKRAPWLPAEVALLLRTATAFERGRRLPHPALLAEDLTALIDGRAPTNAIAFQRSLARRRRTMPAMALAASLAVGLAAGLAWGAAIGRDIPDLRLDEARSAGNLALWRRVRLAENGLPAREAERAIRLLELETALHAPLPAALQPAAPTKLGTAGDEGDEAAKLAVRIASSERTLTESERILMETRADARNQRDQVRPLPPEAPAAALLAARLSPPRIPDLDVGDTVVMTGDWLVVTGMIPRLSRDGGVTWSKLPAVPRKFDEDQRGLIGPVHSDGDTLIAGLWGGHWLRLRRGGWSQIPSPPGGGAHCMAIERSGRLVAMVKDGRIYPGPAEVWTSTDEGAIWTRAGSEPRYLALMCGPAGMTVTSHGDSGGTRIFRPNATGFVPLEGGTLGFTWQFGFALGTDLLLFPPGLGAWLRIANDGRVLQGTCDLRRMEIIDVVELPGSPARLYAWVDGFGIVRSQDRGCTWHASFGVLASLGRSRGKLLGWGPRRNLLLIQTTKNERYVLDDSEAAPGLFPSPFTWVEAE